MSTINDIYLKRICSVLYYSGFGDIWHLNKERSRILVFLNDAIFYLFVIICYTAIGMEVPVIFSDKFSSAEKNDVLNYTYGPSTVIAKWIALVQQRNKVKLILRDILDESLIKDDNESVSRQREKARNNIVGFACGVCGAVSFYTFVGVQKLLVGEPFYTVYTIWPFREDVSSSAQLIRLIYLLLLYVQMSLMVVVDSLCIILMIKLTYKFSTLNQYFKGLRIWYLENSEQKTDIELEDEFRERFVNGLKFHSHILGCAKKVQDSFHVHLSLTISQSAFMVAVSLSRFMVTKHDFMSIVMTLGMMAPLLIMLGIYMAHAGDISHESSLISDAMFNSGWEFCRNNRRQVKNLMLLGSLQGQKPFIMKAFGTYQMSYSAFVSVVKTSYSLFAVLY